MLLNAMQRIPPLSPFCQAAAAEESISHMKCLPAYGKKIPYETFLHIFNSNFYTNLNKIAISLVCFIKTVQNTVTPLVHPHAEGARAVELIRVARSQAHPVRFSQKQSYLINSIAKKLSYSIFFPVWTSVPSGCVVMSFQCPVPIGYWGTAALAKETCLMNACKISLTMPEY